MQYNVIFTATKETILSDEKLCYFSYFKQEIVGTPSNNLTEAVHVPIIFVLEQK